MIIIKFLLIGDRHNSENIPSCRIDDYVMSCNKKDAEIIQLAKDNNVDAILHPGDFWSDADKKLKNDFVAAVANKWNGIYASSGRKIPLIGIAGNHDLIGENLSSYESTTTGLLDSLGIFKMASITNPIMFSDDEGSVAITGVNYHKGMDKPEYISDYIVAQHCGDVHIHIVHGMLSDKNLGKMIRHTKIEHIIDTKADITFCGHDHFGFGVVKEKDKFFINPGAIVRLSANIREIERQIEVVLVEIHGTVITCSEIPLKSALPGKDVIDRSELDKSAELDSFTSSLKESVKTLDIGNNIGMNDILQGIYSEKKIAENIRNDIESAINRNSSTRSSSAKTTLTDSYITKISLENFQSHANTTIDFDKNLNIIVGESRQGKSSILRALRWVIENKPSGKSFIKTGTSNASVTITLKNGTIIERFINAKENGYRIFTPDGKVEEGNTKIVSRVQELMGYSNLEIDEKTSIPLNILRQGDSWYLIGDGYSGTDRARILGALKNTNAADASIKEFEKENSQISSEIKKDEIENANLQLELDTISESLEDKRRLLQVIEKAMLISKINAFVALSDAFIEKDNMVNKIQASFDEVGLLAKIKVLRDNMTKLQSVQKYLGIYTNSSVALDNSNKLIDKIPDIEEIKQKQKSLMEILSRYLRVKSLLNLVQAESQNIALVDTYFVKLDVDFEHSLKRISLLIEKYLKIKTNYVQAIKANNTIVKAEQMIKASKIVDEYADIKSRLSKQLEKLERINRSLSKIKVETLAVEKSEKTFDNVNSKLDEAINNKIEILLSSHVCPTCYSELTDTKMEELIPKLKGDLK